MGGFHSVDKSYMFSFMEEEVLDINFVFADDLVQLTKTVMVIGTLETGKSTLIKHISRLLKYS